MRDRRLRQAGGVRLGRPWEVKRSAALRNAQVNSCWWICQRARDACTESAATTSAAASMIGRRQVAGAVADPEIADQPAGAHVLEPPAQLVGRTGAGRDDRRASDAEAVSISVSGRPASSTVPAATRSSSSTVHEQPIGAGLQPQHAAPLPDGECRVQVELVVERAHDRERVREQRAGLEQDGRHRERPHAEAIAPGAGLSLQQPEQASGSGGGGAHRPRHPQLASGAGGAPLGRPGVNSSRTSPACRTPLTMTSRVDCVGGVALTTAVIARSGTRPFRPQQLRLCADHRLDVARMAVLRPVAIRGHRRRRTSTYLA